MEGFADQINEIDKGHFATHIGLVMESATPERVVGHVDIQPHHTQPAGIVHGGLYSSIVETLASMGGFLSTMQEGKDIAGVENHTSFVRSIGPGSRVTAVATPIHVGRMMHLWQVDITDERERLVARGTVRLAVLDRRERAASGA
jgi:uncharacterized protein (TIGR00369 family)